jgi:thiamine-phosphate pyrophosphorylase
MRRPLLCYITDRTQFVGDESVRHTRLLAKISEAAEAGIDYIQLREKDLSTRDLENLSREALRVLLEVQTRKENHQPRTENREPRTENQVLRTALLINSRTDVALALDADGIHLPAGDISPAEVRRICAYSADARARLTISVSCHSPEEVRRAQEAGADLALFAPVFEKKESPNAKPVGLAALRQACQNKIPVLALGGITLNNAAACLEAEAAGIAAIRLFQENDVADIVRKLRDL